MSCNQTETLTGSAGPPWKLYSAPEKRDPQLACMQLLLKRGLQLFGMRLLRLLHSSGYFSLKEREPPSSLIPITSFPPRIINLWRNILIREKEWKELREELIEAKLLLIGVGIYLEARLRMHSLSFCLKLYGFNSILMLGRESIRRLHFRGLSMRSSGTGKKKGYKGNTLFKIGYALTRKTSSHSRIMKSPNAAQKDTPA